MFELERVVWALLTDVSVWQHVSNRAVWRHVPTGTELKEISFNLVGGARMNLVWRIAMMWRFNRSRSAWMRRNAIAQIGKAKISGDPGKVVEEPQDDHLATLKAFYAHQQLAMQQQEAMKIKQEMHECARKQSSV